MWPFHEDLLATPVPRYTSYPTAADFNDRIDAADMQAGLDGVGADEALSLYLHIPFCEQICWYCGCNTSRSNRSERLGAYLDTLGAEIDLVASKLDGRGRVGRIAFGGGSPNAIAPAAFLALVDRLRRAFGVRAPEMSVEIDPRSFGPEWAAALGEAGVSRVSLGVQTLEPAIQQAIGRVQSRRMIADAVALLRQAGVSSINFDLMYGLPGQDAEILGRTIAESLALGPDRIALFGYAHVPHMIARQRKIDARDLPDARARFGQAALGHELFVAAGYRPVGFDHFALPGDAIAVAQGDGRLRRNFQGFTEDQADVLLGFGATSISQFPDRILQSEKNAGRYRMNVLAGRLPQNRGVLRTGEDRLRADIIEDILCTGVAEFGRLAARDAIAERLRPFADRGLVRTDGYRLALAPQALPYARTIAAMFDAYRQIAPFRFSSAI